MGRKRSQKKVQEKMGFKQTMIFELYGLCLLAFSIIALVQPGTVGRALRSIFRFFAGSWDFIIPLYLLGVAIYVMIKRSWPKVFSFRASGMILICCAVLIFSHISLVQAATGDGRFKDQSIMGLTWELYKEDLSSEVPLVDLGGGMIGALFYSGLNLLFDSNGSKIIVFFLILIGVLLVTGKSYTDMILACKQKILQFFAWIRRKREQYIEMMKASEAEREQNRKKEEEIRIHDSIQDKEKELEEAIEVKTRMNTGDQQEVGNLADQLVEEQKITIPAKPLKIHDFTEVAYSQGEINFPELDNKNIKDSDTPETKLDEGLLEEAMHGEIADCVEEENYQLPPYSLLHKPSRKASTEKKDLLTTAKKLEQTLQSFGVQAKVTDVHRGPAVTRYEVYPDVGVKVSRIVNLTDDIALALAAKGIRIEAPIPGKSAIGIEVPNEDISMVSLREVLESSKYHESESKLSISLGRDISGEPIVAQLNKMPHLLVAGATGSGKSVCINGIIASILYKAKPHEVKLMMIDPKMVELNVYNGIPHLLAPVVTDSRKASIALKKVVSEMERRYEIFSASGTRNIEGYNDLIRRENEKNPEAKKPLLPFIVVIVDELADLMMVAPGDVEDAICRLAQMARAAGIHLIIATQRPSVDVITGVIKANIPSRIAFGVSSQADSRTILDMGGAEKLLGRGDMLFLPVGASKPQRIQGAFVSDEEVEQIVHHCIEQQKAKYSEDMIVHEAEDTNSKGAEIVDDLYSDAVELVVNQGSASVSMLQRRFRIGYARAARLIDTMEQNGVVGPYEGSKPRDVLISKEETNIS